MELVLATGDFSAGTLFSGSWWRSSPPNCFMLNLSLTLFLNLTLSLTLSLTLALTRCWWSWPEGWLRLSERKTVGWWTSPPEPVGCRGASVLGTVFREGFWPGGGSLWEGLCPPHICKWGSAIWSYQFWRLLNSDRRSEPNTVQSEIIRHIAASTQWLAVAHN